MVARIISLVLILAAITVLIAWASWFFHFNFGSSVIPIYIEMYVTPCLAMMAIVCAVCIYTGILKLQTKAVTFRFGLIDLMLLVSIFAYTIAVVIWCMSTSM